ncbi:hypothetical protein LINPERPRIM_LOCUS37570 [Linum perenne]
MLLPIRDIVQAGVLTRLIVMIALFGIGNSTIFLVVLRLVVF